MTVIHIHSSTEILSLSLGGLARDAFGPNSAMPYLAVDLEHLDSHEVRHWLNSLPCPVIGIGLGPLSQNCDVVLENDNPLAKLDRNIRKSPLAAMVLVQHLRSSETLSMTDALTAESFAYGTLQTGPEFLDWKQNYTGPTTLGANDNPLSITPEGDTLHLKMNDPSTHNAIGVKMRDALCEALDMAMIDTSLTRIEIDGTDRVFSVGGAIEEFGEVSDPATAHWVRSLRLHAWRLARLQEKLWVHINGAAIGAGVEIAAFARHITASPSAWFQLPELKYGLIPGAGGTASLPRRIGRERTAYLALSMDKINVQTALEWGLIDRIID